jgi:signal transduction histidine kinase/CheY-like chemotaxis protein
MAGNDPSIFLLPIIFAGLCAGILIVGIVLFAVIYLSSRDRLYLAMVFTCVLGFLFISGEIGIIASSLLKNALMGRRFHFLQSLTSSYFIFSVPYLIYHLLELNIQWKLVNRYIPAVGFCIATLIGAVALFNPDLFVSQDVSMATTYNLRWENMRGRTGIFYNIRDVLICVVILYMFVCMVFELIWHRRYRYIAYPIAGGIIAIGLVYYDFLITYKLIDRDAYAFGYFSFSMAGITFFMTSSMAGVWRMFMDKVRNVEKGMTIESLGVFAGGIAHDFNNYLAAIIGNLSIVRLYCGDHNQEEVITLLADIENAAGRARDLTQQLLTFASGGAPVPAVVSVGDILRDSAHFVLRGCGSAVRCEFAIAEDLKNAKADKVQMSQMFQNIILNGVQSMPEGGIISISAENVRLKRGRPLPDKNGGWIRAAIFDRGTGIPKKYLDRIFDPYFTTKKSGSGLGLTISYSIIKKHNGHISVKSKPGEGALFEIFLPSTDESLSNPADGQQQELNSSGTIILMDDEDLILNVGRRMLERIGFEVQPVKTGEEAIARYRQLSDLGKPAVCVIMDLTIRGGMGGRDAVCELKKYYPRSRAIVSSGYSTDPVVARYREYGFDGMILKPYRLDDLRNTLAEVLNA